MSKKDDALKLALEALEEIALAGMSPAPEMIDSKEAFHARQAWRFIGIAARQLSAIREALAEQETVLPGGGHVPAVPVAVYGYCPECGGAGVMRERRPNGDDKCTNGHKYPSSKALAEQPAQQEPVSLPEKIYEFVPTPEPVKWHHPECEGQCIACLIEQVVQEAYGSQGLGYLQRHLTSPPASKPWVGLTLGDMYEIGEFKNTHGYVPTGFKRLVETIEAKLREKNAQPSKPLTDEEIIQFAQEWPAETNDWASHIDFARAIEAAHGIKE